jgi:hypothetical protein
MLPLQVTSNALPTDAELVMHLVVTFLDERLRTPAVGRAAQAGKPAGPAVGGLGSGAFGTTGGFGNAGGFGAPKPTFGGFGAAAGAFGAAAAAPAIGAALQGASAGGADAAGRRGVSTSWFSTERFLPFADGAAPSKARARGSTAAASGQDAARSLKARPFVEERVGHDPESPQKLCPQVSAACPCRAGVCAARSCCLMR